MAFPPRLLLIGAQKAGTTTLAGLLARHPEMALGKDKEPDFYTRNWHQGLDWYRANYPDPEIPWLIDASPSYTAGFHDPETGTPMPVAARIAQTVPDPRFLFVLRDPVDRAWSAYWHEVRYGAETRPPEEALARDGPYVRASLYAERLSDFLDQFPSEALLTLSFEEVVGAQQSTMDRVCAFLDLAPVALKTEPMVANAGFRYSGPVRAMRRLFPSDRAFSGFVDWVKAATPQRLTAWLKRVGTQEIPPMPESLKAHLTTVFEPHTQRLETMLGKTFANWTRPLC